MKHGLTVETCRLLGVEAVVLVNGKVESFRDIAAPLVIATDAVRVPGLNSAQEVAAHQITAIVCLAKSLQLTVGQRNRLQHVEQRLSLLHHREWLSHHRVSLLEKRAALACRPR
jgi:hypothetical protein